MNLTTYHKKEQSLILTLLQNSISETPAAPDITDIDYQLLNELINEHKIAPTIYKELLALDNKELPEEIRTLAKNTVTTSMVIHTHVRQKLRELSGLFSEKGVEFILLKGFAIDMSPLRQMSDLDVLIHEDEIDRVFKILEAEGYQYVGSFVLSEKEKKNPRDQYRWNNQYQFQMPQSQLVVEIHTNLFERDRIRTEKLDNLLDRVDLFWEKKNWDEALHCYVPTKEASLAVLCMHSAVKYSPAMNIFRLRQSYDIVKMLNTGIDSEYFFSLCHSWKIEYYAFFSIKLASRIFKNQAAEEIVDRIEGNLRRSEKFLARVHLKCYKNIEETAYLYRTIYKLCMPFIIGDGFRKALRWYKECLFPPIYIQERKYGIKRTSPLIYLTYVYGPIRKMCASLAKGVVKVFI